MENKNKDKKKEEVKENNCKCNDNCECHKDNNKEDKKCDCHKEEKSNKECDCNEEEKNDDSSLVDELNVKIKGLEEACLREKAELQNYKRRKDEEMDRILKYKNEDILKELLSVIDNFERAISMDDNDLSDEVSKFLAGFKIIYSNTLNLLNKFDVKEIEASGLEFDPTYHHAVLTEHDENKPAGVVLEVLQKGYMYKDKVIRPAMVKVNE